MCASAWPLDRQCCCVGFSAVAISWLGDDPLDSRGSRRAFVYFVGVPAFVATAWLFERLIFGRRRRYPVIRRRPDAARSDRAWRDRADVAVRQAEEERSSDSRRTAARSSRVSYRRESSYVYRWGCRRCRRRRSSRLATFWLRFGDGCRDGPIGRASCVVAQEADRERSHGRSHRDLDGYVLTPDHRPGHDVTTVDGADGRGVV